MLNFLKNLSPIEMLVIGGILLLIFGRKVFVKMGKSLGETFKEMKNVKKSVTSAFEDEGSDKK